MTDLDNLFLTLTSQSIMAGQEVRIIEDVSRFRTDWLYKIESDGRRVPTRLLRALWRARDAEEMIPQEVERLNVLLNEARNKSRPNPIEIASREYQIWYVGVYLRRASALARERIEYFSEITTEAIARRENEKCEGDKKHWFKYYAWGYDPRARTPLSTVPFELHPRQGELVDWLDEIVFQKRTSGIIEKARDEGATELMVRWGIHNWRYRDGFSMLLSSRTEDEVDTKKKQGTLFSRARFQLHLLPSWMLPKGFDPDKDLLGHMIIANPVNENALQGQPPVENMGRGDRVTCAMFDEFAFWRFGGYPQHTSMSQTTDSILMPSSVAGELNMYADLAHDGVTEKFEMDWKDNPFKDKRWYDALGYGYISPKMSSVAIAQEVDRNYKASQPGKVWTYSEPHMFITWSELVAYFRKFGLGKSFENGGGYGIPHDWSVTRTHDFGKSEGHDWGYLLGAQPREVYPLHDTHFIFLARNLEPTGLTEAQAVAQWTELETQVGVRYKDGKWRITPRASWHSHEQKNLRKVLLGTYGETWIPWDTSYEMGISTVSDWFEIIDIDKPNPFREDLTGRTRIIFVAPDGEYKLAFNERLEEYFITTSVTEEGFYTLRRQIGAYHYPQTELGKAPKDMRPEKVFDDIVDCVIRGTKVHTQRGEISIENVTTNDLVMTRQGWKPVTASAKSADGVTVYTLTDAHGRQISATGNHKIWTANRGFVALRGITVNDILLAWEDQNVSNSTVTPIFGIPTLNGQLTGNIFNGVMDKVSMWRYGRFIMVKFLGAFTSTIRTKIPLTTIFPIWSLFPPVSTFPTTLGIDLMSINCASTAPPLSARRFHGDDSVHGYAKNGVVTGSVWNRLKNNVSGAVNRLRRQATRKDERSQCTVQEVAVRSLVKNGERVSVYNLNVADAHEYFANGILVANCLRGYAVNWNRNPDPPTDEEKVEMHMPNAYKIAELRRASPHQKGLTDRQYIARELIEQEVRETLHLPRKLPTWLDQKDANEIDLDLGDGW